MLSIKEAKMLLTQLGLTPEQTDRYETLITPSIEFHKYLMEKLDISSENVENMTEKYSKTYVSQKMEEYTKNPDFDMDKVDMSFAFKMATEALRELSLINGYDETKANEMSSSMLELLNFLTEVIPAK